HGLQPLHLRPQRLDGGVHICGQIVVAVVSTDTLGHVFASADIHGVWLVPCKRLEGRHRVFTHGWSPWRRSLRPFANPLAQGGDGALHLGSLLVCLCMIGAVARPFQLPAVPVGGLPPLQRLPQQCLDAHDPPNSALVMPRPPRPAVVGVGAGSGFVAFSHCAPVSCSAEWAARQSIPRLASTRRAACVCALSSLPLATSSSFSMRDGGRIFLSVIRRWYSSHSSARRWDSSALRSARVFICRRQLLWGMWPAGLTAPSSQ